MNVEVDLYETTKHCTRAIMVSLESCASYNPVDKLTCTWVICKFHSQKRLGNREAKSHLSLRYIPIDLVYGREL